MREPKRFENPLLKREVAPEIGAGVIVRVVGLAALLAGTAYLARDVIWPKNATPEQAPITGPAKAGDR